MLRFWVAFHVLLLLAACGGGGGSGSGGVRTTNPPATQPPSTPPTANAGLNQTALLGAEVTVYGGLSNDADGAALSYDWFFQSLPATSNASISTTGNTATFTADVTGSYQIGLIVNDGAADSATDSVEVAVVIARALLGDGTQSGMWPNYAGNLSSNKYSPLDEINKSNVQELKVAWRWRSPDNDVAGPQNAAFEATPLMIDGVLYTSTSFSQVAAIDAQTGATQWVYQSNAFSFGTPPNLGFLHRGLAYAEHSGRKYLYIATGDGRLIAINPISGVPDLDFGSLGNGVVDLLDDVPRLNASSFSLDDAHDQLGIPDLAGVRVQLGNSSPPVVCRDVLIVGSSVHDGEVLPPSPPGDVRGYNLNTGALLWTFHTVPREGEFGTATWGNESWRENGNTNVWAPMSADEELGQVYLPVSCPTNNYYGGRRPGDNLFANSIVSLDCATGARNWHFQTVHHDIWDYDLASAPNLVDITVNGTAIKALAQVSKQGFVYVLNRITGEPVWPIVETAVPGPSSIPGEVLSPTQPIPSKPPPFVRQGVVQAELLDPASADGFDVGPLFTPPTTKGLIITPGEGGGANWGGASFDPTTQTLYVTPFGPLTHLVKMEPGSEPNFFFGRPELFFGPSTASPYPGIGSSITAYDLNDGTIKWQVAGAADPSVIGNSSSLVTKSLLFYKNSSLSTLNVFDKETGDLLRSVPVGGRTIGAPMTYMLNGTQYVVVALGRGDDVTELIALTL